MTARGDVYVRMERTGHSVRFVPRCDLCPWTGRPEVTIELAERAGTEHGRTVGHTHPIDREQALRGFAE